ncbi:hypothetical protein ADEAN_000723700 [Angomonas deanei]|uniref:Uncharacterized protein n=1 Tax=Angomonas deanei TaxID=59799 RepID=A0A7G2CIP9_9TRYP|nr:hypothetical protein ADEAN_000723700 [Angomonas deanei]
MGAQCFSSEEPKRPQPVKSLPSPVVSSFGRHGDDSSLTSDEGSCEPGCDGKYSFAGYVPTAKIAAWQDGLCPPEELDPVPEPEIYSDGERDALDWINAESYAQKEVRWDAPRYVSALLLPSPKEEERGRKKKRR